MNNEASFIARGNKPKRFHFNIASGLTKEDQLRIEFYTINSRKRRKKLTAILEIILESLIDAKSIDLPEETLSDAHNYLLPATVKLKLYYTAPDIDKQVAALGYDEKDQIVDWNTMFDDEGRHGGHRHRHKYTKTDNRL